MPARHTVFLVSGANRGLGLGLVEKLIGDPRNFVFAGVRDPGTANALHSLAADYSRRLRIVKLDNNELNDARSVAATIEEEAGFLDVVIANAAMLKITGRLSDTSTDDFIEHFKVNTLAPLALYQAMRPLLLKSPSGQPRFVGISSGAGAINPSISKPYHPYCLSKAGLNYMLNRIILEEGSESGLLALAIHPGWVCTSMGNETAEVFGLEKAPVSVEDSVRGILKLIESASRDTHAGRLWEYTGAQLDW